jgi:hypothetical protein
MHLQLLRSAAVRYVVASIMLAGMPSNLSSVQVSCHMLASRASDMNVAAGARLANVCAQARSYDCQF